jgi:hypothetical protein
MKRIALLALAAVLAIGCPVLASTSPTPQGPQIHRHHHRHHHHAKHSHKLGQHAKARHVGMPK